MNLSENLKRIRKENNLSQEQLAEKLGVSRQSVSKWESNQAYPEMDKMLQISKMFNVGVDDLLNSNITEINKNEASKNSVNKYIDSFLNYITKSVNLFCNMTLKSKIKCLFEQFLIALALLMIFLIIGGIGSAIVSSFLDIFPRGIDYVLYNIIQTVYLAASLILGIILLIHIFKIRYLSYYEINDDNKIKIENRQERIMIRDPKDSDYRFIRGILKCIVIFIKIGFGFIAFWLSISLILLVMSLVLSFLIAKTGLLFLGIIISIVSCIIVNTIVLLVIINFIISRKNNKKVLLVVFLISLVTCGVGIGLSLIGVTKFNYINDIDDSLYIEQEKIIPMRENLSIYSYVGNIEYIEEDREDIKVVYKTTKYYEANIEEYKNDIYFYLSLKDNYNMIKEFIKDINNKQIIDYGSSKIIVYASKENIEKLK